MEVKTIMCVSGELGMKMGVALAHILKLYILKCYKPIKMTSTCLGKENKKIKYFLEEII